MSLRARLLVGYGYLVGLLLLVAGSSTLGFLHLSRGIDRVLTDNVASMTAAMRMLDAFEILDRETLALLVDDETADRRALQEAATDFDEAFADALANVTVAAEQPALSALAEAYRELGEQRQRLLAERPERPLRAFQARLGPARLRAKTELRRLLRINQEAIIEADQAARRSASRSASWLGLLVLAALLSFGVLSRELSRRLLDRLAALRTGLQAIASGDRRRRLSQDGSDELALIARDLNLLVDRQDEHEGYNRARMAQQHRVVLAALSALGRPAALLDRDGDLLASTLEGDLVAFDAAIRAVASAETPTVPGLRCTPLVFRGERCGWLVEPTSEAAP